MALSFARWDLVLFSGRLLKTNLLLSKSFMSAVRQYKVCAPSHRVSQWQAYGVTLAPSTVKKYLKTINSNRVIEILYRDTEREPLVAGATRFLWILMIGGWLIHRIKVGLFCFV